MNFLWFKSHESNMQFLWFKSHQSKCMDILWFKSHQSNTWNFGQCFLSTVLKNFFLITIFNQICNCQHSVIVDSHKIIKVRKLFA